MSVKDMLHWSPYCTDSRSEGVEMRDRQICVRSRESVTKREDRSGRKPTDCCVQRTQSTWRSKRHSSSHSPYPRVLDPSVFNASPSPFSGGACSNRDRPSAWRERVTTHSRIGPAQAIRTPARRACIAIRSFSAEPSKTGRADRQPPPRSRAVTQQRAEGIEVMEREEAAYWLGIAMHRPNTRRVLTARRVLLTPAKQGRK